MNVETIRAGEGICCYIVRPDQRPSRTVFFTEPEAALQAGQIVHERGHEIERHKHSDILRQVVSTAEVILVQHGRCEIDVYDSTGMHLATRKLVPGDIVVLCGCGHGFRMMEDTVLFEVKQGPYVGDFEKVRF